MRRFPFALGLLALVLVATVLAACGSDPPPTEVLRNQVLSALHADVRIAPYEVKVEVEEGGRVILSGNAERPEVKTLAESLAHEVEGVREVVNQINVRGPRAEEPTP